MYRAKVNSPSTTISVGIDAVTTSITVADASVLPTAPNLLSIGLGDTTETCLYTAIAGNMITVQRGFEGIAKAWNIGDLIERCFTSYDHNAFIDNINDVKNKAIAMAIALS